MSKTGSKYLKYNKVTGLIKRYAHIGFASDSVGDHELVVCYCVLYTYFMDWEQFRSLQARTKLMNLSQSRTTVPFLVHPCSSNKRLTKSFVSFVSLCARSCSGVSTPLLSWSSSQKVSCINLTFCIVHEFELLMLLLSFLFSTNIYWLLKSYLLCS